MPTPEPVFSSRGVDVYTVPWVSGMRAGAYFGRLSVEIMTAQGESGIPECLERLCRESAGRGGNSCVGLEISVDPFRDGRVWWQAIATSARLEPLLPSRSVEKEGL